MAAYYAILHLFVDGICALAMFGVFIPREDGYLSMLLYNFCAFALQMPFGVLIDLIASDGGQDTAKPKAGGKRGWKWRGADIAFLTAATGVACTIAGAVSHPIVLGIGNALFHVGGGVGTIQEDFGKGWKGKGLGVFVAPGAFGLYVGTLAGKRGLWQECFWAAGALAALLCLCMAGRAKAWGKGGEFPQMVCQGRKEKAAGIKNIAVPFCCFLVVVLRSYLGMSVTFPWKAGTAAGMLCVLALVFGKMAGGFFAARNGSGRVAAASLALAAFCYLFSGSMPMGLSALFLFNMTMPITLYWMACRFPKMPGLAFGILTFGLFLGFLPGYFGILPGIGGDVLGCAGSLVSLALIGGIRWSRSI